MTRETKIGLVVAGSFLCLVAIVIASKWKRGDAPPGNDAEEQSKFAAMNKALQSPGGEPKKSDAPPVLPQVPERKDVIPPSVSIPPGPISRMEFKPDIILPPAPTPSGQPMFPGSQNPVMLPPQNNNGPTFPPLPLPGGGGFPPLEQPKKDNRPTISFGTVEPKNPAVPPLTDKGGPPLPPLSGNPQFPGLDRKNDGPALPPLPMKDIVIAPLPKNDNPVFPALPKNDNPFPALPKNDGPVFPALPKKDAPPLITITPPIGLPKDAPKSNDPPSSFTFPALTPGHGPTIPAKDTSLPTISIKPPTVNRFNPDFTEFKFGEMTFRDLSKRLYGDAKYGDALQAYNRENSKLILNGENLAAFPPRIDVGQRVIYPPKELLERDFPALISGVAPVAPSTTPIVRITPPVSLDPVATPVSVPSVTNPGTYTVGPGGERIRDIARRYLGNADLWTEVYRLNPSVRPEYPIPAGTQLRLR